MRLDFNVLWVEDQPDSIKAQVDAISLRMLEHGFSFSPTVCRSLDQARAQVDDDVFNDDVDMVMVDWDLGGGSRGQEAIKEIRRHIQYKDVIFYSAKTNVAELRQAAYDENLEGIYCAGRNDLVDEVLGVFESLVKKVLDLDHTRGVVMGATSDIDNVVKECLAALLERMGEHDKARMAGVALKKVSKRLEGLNTDLAELHKNPSLTEIMKKHGLFQANDALRLLTNVLKEDVAIDCSAYRNQVQSYMDNIVPNRNKLGHRVLDPAGKPVGIQAIGGDFVSLDEMRTLRCSLLELRDSFRELHGILHP